MNEHITISKQKPQEKSLRYEELREEGIINIEKLGSDNWTDYNIHDPGITMLEMLCYAITDLGYRTSFPVQNLLATATGNDKNYAEQFFSAKQILPSRPVTENDYRKLFIDLPEIKNAWLFKAEEKLFIDKVKETITAVKPETNKQTTVFINGLYDIKIEFHEALLDGEDTPQGTKQREAIIEQVRKKFHAARNLCEDVKTISAAEEEEIIVCADVEITSGAKADQVYGEILFAIQNYLTPEVKQFTLEQMLTRKKKDGSFYTTDEIFNGPFLENGFIPDEEIEKSGLRKAVYSSDIISLVMDIKDVVAVNNVMLNYCKKENEKEKEACDWCLPVTEGKKPTLCIDKIALHFYKDVVPVKTSREKAINIYNEKIAAAIDAAGKIISADFSFDKGEFADTSGYTSIIHHLPKAYGVSDTGLPGSATADRQAKAKQLKAYLLFFDQLLANYTAQLANVKELFRLKNDDVWSYIPQTYFTQKIKAVKDIEKIITGYSNFDTTGILQRITESLATATERKNRFLDHLLTRFAEQFTEYALQLFTVYGPKPSEELIIEKSTYLNEYISISAERSGAYNYYDTSLPVWDTTNVSGMEHRVARLMGYPDYERKNLSGIIFTNEITKTTVNGTDEFRFRIADETNKILLTGTSKYATKAECEKNLLLTVQLAAHAGNYETKASADGKFFFNISTSNGTILARRIEFFTSMDDLYKARNAVIKFVRFTYNRYGMYVVEHLLLRQDIDFLLTLDPNPGKDFFLPVCTGGDCDECDDDPYSFRVSIVLPAQTPAFEDIRFRENMEKLIRMETPAHIYPRICWVADDVMKQFEEAYQKWLKLKQAGKINSDEGQTALKNFIKILYSLRSIYPKGKLMEIEDENKPVKPVITGRTQLGEQ